MFNDDHDGNNRVEQPVKLCSFDGYEVHAFQVTRALLAD